MINHDRRDSETKKRYKTKEKKFMRMDMKQNKGVTLIALIVTIIVLIILAGITITALNNENDGVINQANDAKKSAELADWNERIDIAIVNAEEKNLNPAMGDVIDELIRQDIIDSESQVDTETGKITTNAPSYVIEGKLDDYIVTIGDIYYGDANAVPTDSKYFTFTYNNDTKEATLTGVKEEYGVKAYYGGVPIDYISAIKDGDTYITDITIPYEVTNNGTTYQVTGIGEDAFSLGVYRLWYLTRADNPSYPYETTVDKAYTSFVIPNTIKTIGPRAFSCCVNVETIKIPKSVITMESSIFYMSHAGTLNVYCEASSQPVGWSAHWNSAYSSSQTINVYWGSY